MKQKGEFYKVKKSGFSMLLLLICVSFDYISSFLYSVILVFYICYPLEGIRFITFCFQVNIASHNNVSVFIQPQ